MAEARRGPTGALTRLTAVSRALTYAVSLDEVLDITVDCAADLLEAPRVVLMLRDDEGLLRVRAALGCDPEAVESFREPLDETLISHLSRLLGPDAPERFLGVPLVVGGLVIGLLAVLRPEDRAPEERDDWLLSALADQASVALENARGGEGRTTLESRVAELERLRSSREDALRMIGHDLRNPLSALNGYVHLLGSEAYGPLNDAQHVAVGRLRSIAAHLESLVANVVEIGRLAAGGLELTCLPVPLPDVASSAADILQLDAQNRGVELAIDVPPDTTVVADADRLRQVLIHLLDNALKHAPAGTAVRIEAATEGEGDGAVVAIAVSDQGPGVPAEAAETIFEPYRRLEGTGGAGTGMGLGLAIARGLVQVMDGTLVLDTSASAGARFVLRLPAA